jgi:HTH-type transcriptional regulator, sugar sensing transcriptional regulator
MKNGHQKKLQQFGLSAKEALVYETLLKIGAKTAGELAESTRLNRSTTYVQLKTLMNTGLVTSFKVVNKTMFSAESPENLERLLNNKIIELKKRKKQITDLLPDLVQTFISHSVKPVIRHFHGKDGLAAMRDEIFSSRGDKIRMIMNYDDLRRVFTSTELKAYSDKRKKQKMESFIIYSLAEGDDFIQFPNQFYKRIKKGMQLFGCDVYIYGNTVSFAAMKNEVVGVSIDQRDIADTMKILFDAYWDFHPKMRRDMKHKYRS